MSRTRINPSRSHHSLSHTADDGSYHNFDIQFDPEGPYGYEPLVHIDGDDAIVCYLSHDEDPSDPMEDCDCQGQLITWHEGVKTDDQSAMLSALELYSMGEIDFYRAVTVGGVRQDYAQHVCQKLYDDLDADDTRDMLLHLNAWGVIDLDESTVEGVVSNEILDGSILGMKTTYEEQIKSDLVDNGGRFSERLEDEIKRFYTANWKEVVGPYVLPVSYFSERGSTSISLTTWDGDPDDLPNAIWVADKNVQDNLPAPDAPDFEEKITAYAESVLKEYASWCEGDVWGVVVEAFTLSGAGDWEGNEADHCWGHIGGDWAKAALMDQFKHELGLFESRIGPSDLDVDPAA